MREKEAASRIEQAHRQPLLGGSFEGFLLGSLPEFPCASIAGAIFGIVLLLFWDLLIHEVSRVNKKCPG